MNKKPKIKISPAVVVVICICLVVGAMIAANVWISGEVDRAKDWSGSRMKTKIINFLRREKPLRSHRIYNKVIRRTWRDPNRQYWGNDVFGDDKKVGSFKSKDHEVFDIQGEIPDGKAYFFDQTSETYGTEYWMNQKRHGWLKEYYSNDNLKRETLYSMGRVEIHKEYFFDGNLRMERDMRDAMWLTDNPETGEGKLYYRDGTLMYEWSLTNLKNGGFNKSYDVKGQLVEENIYDQNGDVVQTQNIRAKRQQTLERALQQAQERAQQQQAEQQAVGTEP